MSESVKSRILIAGIGNIFLGDDAFGVEVVRWLAGSALPDGIVIKDFGIRSFDLAYALLDPWEAVILVDAVPRGNAPGTLCTMEISLDGLEAIADIDAHSMNPVKVLQLAKSSGKVTAQIYLVGCEPEDCGGREGRMGLTSTVQQAVEGGAQMAADLALRLLAEKTFAAVE